MTILGTALVLVLIAGLAAVSWQWRRAEVNAETAIAKSEEADRKRAEAEENFRTMLQVVDQYLMRISENRLLNEPGMQPLRKDLLETARGFYERFVETHRDDVVFRAERARSLQRLANISLILGDPVKSIKLYHEALSIQQELVNEHPETPGHLLDLGFTWNNLGISHERVGERDKAEAAYRQALELSEQGTGSAFRLMAARGHINRGKVLGEKRSPAAAIPDYEKALAISQQLVHDRLELPDSQRTVAICFNNLGDVHRLMGQPGRAENSLRQAATAWEDLLKNYPRDLHARDEWCRTSFNLIAIFLASGRTTDARAACDKCFPAIKELAARNPNLSKYLNDVRGWHNLQGLVYQREGKYDLAKSSFEEAIRLSDLLKSSAPITSTLAAEPAIFRMNVANLLREQDQAQSALTHYDQAIAILIPFTKKNPLDFVARFWLCQIHHERAIALKELGRHADAAADWNRARTFDNGNNVHLAMLLRGSAEARVSGLTPTALLRDHYAEAITELARYEGPAIAFGSEFYTFAQLYALASRAAADDTRLAAADRGKRSADYAAHAVALLKRAQADGYFRFPARLARLKTDPELDGLRQREDFKELVKE